MNRRIATLSFLIATSAAVACIDMSAPNGVASVSALLLPSPSVVRGDTMRDSTGAAAPVRVIAYDANENQVSDLTTQFFITDTGALAHIANGNIVVGDKLGIVHLVGQVAGVQTTPVTLLITVAPTVLARSGTLPDTFVVPITSEGDTTSASTGSTPIAVTLKGKGDTASLGFVVKYELLYAPATVTSSKTPAVFFGVDASKPSSVDTTDGSGASRTLFVKSALLADAALKAGQKVDSAVVSVSTSYKGVQVSGSPIRIVLPIKVALKIQ